jgi:hypothetical protein
LTSNPWNREATSQAKCRALRIVASAGKYKVSAA